MTDETISPLKEARFKISNMACEGCAEKIRTALTVLPGVKDVKSKVFQKNILVNYHPAQINQEELKKALEAEGFTAVEE